MYRLKYSRRFKKDLKKIAKNKTLLQELETLLDLLTDDKKINPKYYNHKLQGEFKNCYECHIGPDVLLIYKKNKKDLLILLLRIGPHSKLFG